MGRLSTSLSLALLALAFGAAPNSASAAPADSSGGGAGGTAAASSGEGDVTTAVDGDEGTDGTTVELPPDLGSLLESLLTPEVTPEASGAESSAMMSFAAPLPVAPVVAGGDEAESDAEGEPEDPNAHVDRSGVNGQSVTVVGTEEEATQRVTVQGEDGSNGTSAQEVSQEVGSGEGLVLPSADDLTDAMALLQ